jgi:outer membrane immunogenic protein
MKRFTLALAISISAGSAALAADLRLPPSRAARAPVSVAAPLYNWTGFYVGGNLGRAWRRTCAKHAASTMRPPS